MVISAQITDWHQTGRRGLGYEAQMHQVTNVSLIKTCKRPSLCENSIVDMPKRIATAKHHSGPCMKNRRTITDLIELLRISFHVRSLIADMNVRKYPPYTSGLINLEKREKVILRILTHRHYLPYRGSILS